MSKWGGRKVARLTVLVLRVKGTTFPGVWFSGAGLRFRLFYP